MLWFLMFDVSVDIRYGNMLHLPRATLSECTLRELMIWRLLQNVWRKVNKKNIEGGP